MRIYTFKKTKIEIALILPNNKTKLETSLNTLVYKKVVIL